MPKQRPNGLVFWGVQLLTLGAVVASFAMAAPSVKNDLYQEITGRSVPHPVVVPRTQALVITPLYDDPEVVSDDELAAVLKKIQPRFPQAKLKPNHVEHALRTWSIGARFQDPAVMSGAAMKDYLVDHGKYLASWGDQIEPLLMDRPHGVAIRWGKEECASVHHDHWLACLSEAGVTLTEPITTPSRSMTIADALQEALRDFRLDEVETEWSTLAFALWLAPTEQWQTRSGRRLNFDLLAERLMRGEMKLGVCAGTHRVYSLMALLRLDDEHHFLSKAIRDRAYRHLESVRDRIMVSQFPDGHWPSNWPDGADAVAKPVADELYRQVIATGHHLEWLAIAPQALHPPKEQILKAADWVIATTLAQSDSDILQRYTFFSHVGNALALWRKTHPPDFWHQWEAAHPWTPAAPVSANEPESAETN